MIVIDKSPAQLVVQGTQELVGDPVIVDLNKTLDILRQHWTQVGTNHCRSGHEKILEVADVIINRAKNGPFKRP